MEFLDNFIVNIKVPKLSNFNNEITRPKLPTLQIPHKLIYNEIEKLSKLCL